MVSIRAPRTGSDGQRYGSRVRGLDVSIRAPRTGSDAITGESSATSTSFNPRPPHGERRVIVLIPDRKAGFQSAPPARGATKPRPGGKSGRGCFNPRPPHGERRGPLDLPRRVPGVSIRAPRTGSDAGITSHSGSLYIVFQSAPPARGATGISLSGIASPRVSIRAPRTGSDHGERPNVRDLLFQSAPPARGATSRAARCALTEMVSIRAPRTGSDD